MKTGGCECKTIRYQYSGEPLTCYACHCTDCQTISGSAFGMSMIVNEKDFQVMEGEMTINTVDKNGIQVNRHYCDKCGVIFYFSASEYAGIVALKPGTFDDTSWFRPVAHVWTRSAQPWVVFADDTVKYEQQPELGELVELWKQQ